MVNGIRLRAATVCTALALGSMLNGCHAAGSAQTIGAATSLQQFLPNPQYTPGAVMSVTRTDVCTPDYARNARDVPIEEKEAVYREYGILHHTPHQYEVDHLIPLEIGGSNEINNLWPQPMNSQPWNAHVKDKLENRLHDLVCGGRLGMKQAQQMIASNWITTYQQVFHTKLPLSHYPRHRFINYGQSSGDYRQGRSFTSYTTSPNNTKSTDNSEKVWVNTNSGKFFTSNQRWYGRTRRGAYMSRSAAVQQGYVAAGGE